MHRRHFLFTSSAFAFAASSAFATSETLGDLNRGMHAQLERKGDNILKSTARSYLNSVEGMLKGTEKLSKAQLEKKFSPDDLIDTYNNLAAIIKIADLPQNKKDSEWADLKVKANTLKDKVAALYKKMTTVDIEPQAKKKRKKLWEKLGLDPVS